MPFMVKALAPSSARGPQRAEVGDEVLGVLRRDVLDELLVRLAAGAHRDAFLRDGRSRPEHALAQLRLVVLRVDAGQISADRMARAALPFAGEIRAPRARVARGP